MISEDEKSYKNFTFFPKRCIAIIAGCNSSEYETVSASKHLKKDHKRNHCMQLGVLHTYRKHIM